jgi:hypothetical protein
LEINAAASAFFVFFLGGSMSGYSAQEKYPTGTSDFRLVVIATVIPFLHATVQLRENLICLTGALPYNFLSTLNMQV